MSMGAGKKRGIMDKMADRYHVTSELTSEQELISGAQNSYMFFINAMNAHDFSMVSKMFGHGLNNCFSGWLGGMSDRRLRFKIDHKAVRNIVPLGRATFLNYSKFDEVDEPVIYVSRPHITSLLSEEDNDKRADVSSIAWVEIVSEEELIIIDEEDRVVFRKPGFSNHIWKFGARALKGSKDWDIRVIDIDGNVAKNFVEVYTSEKLFLDPFSPRGESWLLTKLY